MSIGNTVEHFDNTGRGSEKNCYNFLNVLEKMMFLWGDGRKKSVCCQLQTYIWYMKCNDHSQMIYEKKKTEFLLDKTVLNLWRSRRIRQSGSKYNLC